MGGWGGVLSFGGVFTLRGCLFFFRALARKFGEFFFEGAPHRNGEFPLWRAPSKPAGKSRSAAAEEIPVVVACALGKLPLLRADFVASYRPSRGSLRFAIWRQVKKMTTKTCNSSSPGCGRRHKAPPQPCASTTKRGERPVPASGRHQGGVARGMMHELDVPWGYRRK